MIELTHISKEFGAGQRKVHAVQDVSLSIEKGEIFGIIGFSGAGKSTLVRCINLLERPTAGTVTVDGKELTALSQKELRQARKKIGMIFQHFNLMPSRTAFGNVAYPLCGSGLSRQEISDKVRRLLELVGIGDKAEAYPSQLSGGQKQRVAIARALANDPNVLLCDEATSALDFGLKTEEAIYQDTVLDVEEYWNLIAARTADLNDPDKVASFEKVVKAFQSPETEKVFNETYGGYFIKVGWDQDLLAK